MSETGAGEPPRSRVDDGPRKPGREPIEESPSGERRRRVSVVQTIDHGAVLRETRRAIFLDRDGTLIRDVGYPKDPDKVELLTGVAMALRTAHNVQMAVIVVSNQSGIARGLLTTADYEAVRKRMHELLAEFGAFVDGEYFCPHHPEFTGPCDCRKPALALYERAIVEHGIEPSESAFIGDRWRDVAPASHYAGLGILVPSSKTPPEDIAHAESSARVVSTLKQAIDMAIANRPA